MKDVFHMTEKRSYPKEFKEYVTKMVVQDGRKIIAVRKELDIPYDTLQKWAAAYKKKQRTMDKEKQDKLLTATEYEASYKRELEEKLELQEENEILKKAMHIFTQEKE